MSENNASSSSIKESSIRESSLKESPIKELPFEELGLSPSLSRHLDRLGYKKPTPIQEQSIPVLLKGRDLLGQAQTGTGKTAAFALPLINKLNSNNKSPQILVLTPTRELAIQVYESFKTYAKDVTNFRGVPIYGGASIVTQLKDLKRGAQVVVGTPGRVMDHLRRKTLDLSSLSTIVLDEADEMLKMGFVEDIDWILEHTPKTKQVALFSATMPDRNVAARGIDVERVSHVINFDAPHDNESYVHRIGRTGRAGRKGTALLFVSPREMRVLNSIERSTNQRIEEYDLP
ncbi:UNVERIFIED_CONTAM: hypothetical protein GTU68_010799, partial [Idotea baltica]|nr:hypothetical protein [Idotea baltica]